MQTSVLLEHTIVMYMPIAPMLKDHLIALANVGMKEMVPTVKVRETSYTRKTRCNNP